MSETLDHIFRDFNPFLKTPADFYCDCREARGGDAFINKVISDLEKNGEANSKTAVSADFLRFLFSGHSGCGKSTELLELTRKLKSREKAKYHYFPILINTNDYLDVYDVSIEEILLSIVTELAESFSERLGIKLENSYFTKRLNELKDFFLTDIDIEEGNLGIYGSSIKVKRLKKSPEAREKVRESLKKRKSTILEELNLLFQRARIELRNKRVEGSGKKYSDFVIILDNLEKIQQYQGSNEGLKSFERLFIDNQSQLTDFQAHVIYTVPLELVRSGVGDKLESLYGEKTILPMVKVFDRKTNEPFEKGYMAMKSIVEKRLRGKKVEDVFDKEAIEFLIKYSGGSVRELVKFVRRASGKATELPIKKADAEYALKSTIQSHSTAIHYDSDGKTFDHWEKLAKLSESPDQKIPDEDEHYQILLGTLNILEYLNGGSENLFEANSPWYAVNPIDKELSQFKLAVKKIIAETSKIEQ